MHRDFRCLLRLRGVGRRGWRSERARLRRRLANESVRRYEKEKRDSEQLAWTTHEAERQEARGGYDLTQRGASAERAFDGAESKASRPSQVPRAWRPPRASARDNAP